MLRYRAQPYPQELYFGVQERTQNHIRRNFERSNFHRFNHLQFGNNVSGFNGRLIEGLQLDFDQIVNDHTLIPFISNFISNDAVRAIKEGLLKNRRNDWDNYFIRNFQYCPMCVDESRDIYGEAYWKRANAVTRWNVCHEHGCYLHEAHLEQHYKYQRLVSAELTIPKHSIVRKCSDVERTIASEIFSLVVGETKLNWEILSSSLATCGYELLQPAAFSEVSKKVCLFMEKFNLALPLKSLRGKEFTYERMIGQKSYKPLDPMFLIIANYLSTDGSIYAIPKSRSQSEKTVHKNGYYVQDCECGNLAINQFVTLINHGRALQFCIDCLRCHSIDRLGNTQRIYSYGVRFQRTLKEMIEKGFSVRRICRTLSITHYTFLRESREIDFQQTFFYKLILKRMNVRALFLKTQRVVAQNKKLYKWLHNYDREWLLENVSCWRTKLKWELPV